MSLLAIRSKAVDCIALERERNESLDHQSRENARIRHLAEGLSKHVISYARRRLSKRAGRVRSTQCLWWEGDGRLFFYPP